MFAYRIGPRSSLRRARKSSLTAAYAELHCHSAYSFLDGASRPEELATRAHELGYETLALTDHDNLCGALEFAHAAKALGVRPITGCELTVEDEHGPFHVTLLVETRVGYSNLSQLLTAAHAHDRTGPRTPLHLLCERAEGLVCLTGCARHGALVHADERVALERCRLLYEFFFFCASPSADCKRLKTNVCSHTVSDPDAAASAKGPLDGRLRGAPLPLGLLLPRRRLAAGGARRPGARARPRRARADRPRQPLRRARVRARGQGAGRAADHRLRADGRGRARVASTSRCSSRRARATPTSRSCSPPPTRTTGSLPRTAAAPRCASAPRGSSA